MADDVEISGQPGVPITLPIGRTAATGYSWRLELPDGVELVEAEQVQPAEGPNQLGAMTGANLQVTAPAGDHLIVAELARPWESEPINRIRFLVHVS